jgi:nucleoside-diphosphate-sugar epimerase
MHTILGINGTTGVEIAKQLTQMGLPVRGVSRRPYTGTWEHISADVFDLGSLKKAIAGSETVYCCVGLEYNIKVWRRDWVNLIDNVIEACLTANAKLVFVDNVYMYGKVVGEMTENTPMHPTSEKGKIRKAVAERLLGAFQNRGLRGCIARSADFYGPDNPKSVISTVFDNFQKGNTPQYIGNPDKIHSFTYVPDIGKACAILGTDKRADGQVWHIPTAAPPLTGRQIIEKAAILYETKPKLMAMSSPFLLTILGIFIPALRELKEMMYQFTDDYVFNSDKFERTFGMEPTPYDEGIKETVQFYARKKE